MSDMTAVLITDSCHLFLSVGRRSSKMDDDVKIHEESVPPTPGPPSAPDTPVTLRQEGQTQTEDKLHLSQVSLWDTLSATGRTHGKLSSSFLEWIQACLSSNMLFIYLYCQYNEKP